MLNILIYLQNIDNDLINPHLTMELLFIIRLLITHNS